MTSNKKLNFLKENIFRLTKPDSFAMPMPNFYETSKTQRRSSLFVKLQNYFHGPDILELPLPGGKKRYRKYNL
jgi:hypothetical protein